MATKKKRKQNKAAVRLNPAFDSRILHLGQHLGGAHTRLKRGWMVHADNLAQIRGIGGGTGGDKGRIHFLYNPQQITASHNLDFTQANGGKPNNGTNALPTLNVGDVSVDLLFDRTYELWDRSKKDTQAGKYGVYADVWAFYMFFGMTEVTVGSGNPFTDLFRGSLGKGVNTWSSLYPVSPLQATPLYLYIGDKLKYYGIATGMSVTYTHWTHRMVPARCVVNVSVGLAADPNAVSKKERKKVSTKKPGGLIGKGSGKPDKTLGGILNPNGRLRP